MKVHLILSCLLTTTAIFHTESLEIVKIINVAENLALDVDKGVAEGKKVVLWNVNSDTKWQRWIVDINGAKYGTPSTFQSLDQDDTGVIKVLDEDQATNTAVVWGNSNSTTQKWYFIWAAASKNYLMVNQANSKCLCSNGWANQVITVSCNSSDTKQHWRIENFSQVTRYWQENWFEHAQNLELNFGDNDVTLYYDQDMDMSVQWTANFVGDVWRYSKHTYGNFGPDPRLYAIFHQGNYAGEQSGYYYSSTFGNRNIIDVSSGSWTDQKDWNIDVIVHEISHIVESTTKGFEGSPAAGVWRDSKWGDIFSYDVYKGIGEMGEAQRIYDLNQNVHDDFPKPGTQWFKNWFWPIYSNYGGTSVLVRYYDMLIAHWPKRGFSYNGGMNLGEFVHFWSGAARTNLTSLASNAFGWDNQFESEYQSARNKFPGIIY